MTVDLNRRSLITGLIAFAATAPAIVRAQSIMPVRAMVEDFYPLTWDAARSFNIGDIVFFEMNRYHICIVAGVGYNSVFCPLPIAPAPKLSWP